MADALINPDYLTVGQIDTTTTAIRDAARHPCNRAEFPPRRLRL